MGEFGRNGRVFVEPTTFADWTIAWLWLVRLKRQKAPLQIVGGTF